MWVWESVCESARSRENEKETERGRMWREWGCGIVITSKVIIIITAGWSHALASLKLWSLCKAVVLSAGTEYITEWITREHASRRRQTNTSSQVFPIKRTFQLISASRGAPTGDADGLRYCTLPSQWGLERHPNYFTLDGTCAVTRSATQPANTVV